MAIFKIQHITKYQYDAPIRESGNQIKVFPYHNEEQEILNHELTITGDPAVNKFTDYWGNTTGFFTVLYLEKELVIDSRLIIRVKPKTPAADLISTKEDWGVIRSERVKSMKLLDFSHVHRVDGHEEIAEYLFSIQPYEKSPLEVLFALSHFIFEQFQYVKGITTIETTVSQVWEQKKGVCQDFAHVLLYMLRYAGAPARYVSGYICPNKNGMRGEGATHAWVEAWIPGAGWVGVDPTNDVFTDDNYVTLAVGRDFIDCTPVKGAFKGPANESLNVYVSVGYEDGYVFQQDNAVEIENFAPRSDKDAYIMGQ